MMAKKKKKIGDVEHSTIDVKVRIDAPTGWVCPLCNIGVAPRAWVCGKCVNPEIGGVCEDGAEWGILQKDA